MHSKSNSSEDCVIVEKAHSYHSHPKGQGASAFLKVEEEERAHGNGLGTKRGHMEISSPGNDIAKSPSSNEETQNDGFGKGFVTARAKLVSILLLAKVFLCFFILFYLSVSIINT